MLTLSRQPIPTSSTSFSFPMSMPGDSPIDPNNPTPVRIPKLAVRNRIEGLEPPPHLRGLGLDVRAGPVTTQQQPQSAVEQDDAITPVISKTTSTIKRRTSTRPDFNTRDSQNSANSNDSNDGDESLRPWSPSSYDPSSRSLDMSRTSFSIAPSTTKKSGLFGFLKIQEPSTKAWEEYAELRKREQALRGAQGKALPEKKLPDNVPKVNSKWNGLPDHAQPPKGKPWKSSLDISRTTLSRNTRHSDDKGSVRPSTAESSGHSSTSSGKTVRKTTTRQSDTGSSDSSKSKKTITARSAAAAERIGPAMSTDSIEPAPAAVIPSSIPASSLFFPAEQAAPRYTQAISNPHSSSESQVTTGQPSPTIPDFPKVPHSSPQVATPETLPTEPQDTAISSEEATPTQEQPSDIVQSVHQRTISDVSVAPASPVTPDPGTPLGPHNYHNRFARNKSKSVEKVPQWPLPTKPDEATSEGDASTSIQGIAITSHPHSGSTTTPTSPSNPTFNFAQTDGPSDNEDITPTGSPAISPILDPGLDFTHSPPIDAAPFPRAASQSQHLIPPARLPGRVKTRPFDLDTIAESDAGSVRAPSLYLSPHMSTTELRDAQAQAQAQNIGSNLSGRTSLAASRASSEMSAQWHMSPKERLGLGGLIKQKAKKAPWPESGNVGGVESEGVEEAGGYFVGMDGNWTVAGERKERRGLMGRLRR